MGVYDTLQSVFGTHPVRSKDRQPPVFGRVTAPQYEEGCLGVVLKKYRECIPHCELLGSRWSQAWSSKEKMLRFANGSTIQFKSSEQDINTFGGADLDWCWDDEHIPWPYFIENFARLTDRNGYYIKTETPEAGAGMWEWDYIDNPPDGITVDDFYFDTDRNPYLSAEGVRQLKAQYARDPILAEAKLHGRRVILSGAVIPQYNPQIHIVPDRTIRKESIRVFCIDCHLKTPSAAMWAAWELDPVLGYRLIVYRTIKAAKTVPEWKRIIRNASANERIDYWLGDETESERGGTNVYGHASIITEFNSGTDPIPIIQVTKGPNSYDARIYKIRDMFSVDPVHKKSRIEIFKSCDYGLEYHNGKPTGSLPWELLRFGFKRETKADEETLREHVRKVNDHYIDDLCYIASVGPINVTREINSPLNGSW